MESLWTWLSTPPAKGEVLDAFGVFSLLLFAPGVCGLGVPLGTWRGSTREGPGSARWNPVLCLARTVGVWRRSLFLWGSGDADQPTVVRRAEMVGREHRRRHLRRRPLRGLVANGLSSGTGTATSPRKPCIQSPILGAALAARRPDNHCRKRSRANKRRYAERPALIMSEASKIGRAPLVDLDAPACRRSPAQVRLPLVTQGGRFTAATFRS